MITISSDQTLKYSNFGLASGLVSMSTGFSIPTMCISTNSLGAKDFAENGRISRHTKHIDIRHQFLRDHVEKKNAVG